MITSAFDGNTQAIIRPEELYAAHINGAHSEAYSDVCIITFSRDAVEAALQTYDCETVSVRPSLGGDLPIYRLRYKKKKVTFYLSAITSAGAGMYLEEARCIIGAKHYIMFGSCGILDQEIASGKLVVPTEAYREEGFSYHYRPADSYIPVRNAEKVAAMLKELGLPHVSGRTWTTDAIYRETRGNMEKRRAEGCIAVDMECAGLQALCDFYGLEYYPFFYSGDLLDAPEWDRRILGQGEERTHQLRNFDIALEMAAML